MVYKRIKAGWAQSEARLVNFVATAEDQAIIERLALATDRDASYILRRALRLVTVADLMVAEVPSGNGDTGRPANGDPGPA